VSVKTAKVDPDSPAGRRSGPGRFVSVLEGIQPYQRAWLPKDVIAGITLAALAIPEVMGYTKIAGMPVITGLYTILIPIAAFALLGSSRHLVVGADSASPSPRRETTFGASSIASGSPTRSAPTTTTTASRRPATPTTTPDHGPE
jgi:hypothetical protein